ncbi:MAG: GAF domain-containing protein [Sphingomonas sanxanigenens]|uniref:GAF domain-containing protein n=1 Tax=Sphingomonas sanxanigenens TaxID=397260 RepID=A0A2W5C666_9SPHN|nr:MAG: GAF domain-containing protein [Sphingomonas sanxanigenens]
MTEPAILARWSALVAAIQRLSVAGSIDDVVAILRESTRKIAASDGITVVRRRGENVEYVAEDALAPLWVGQSFPIKACVSGLAMLDRRPIIIPDVGNDPRLVYNYYRDTFVGSMAMFPVGFDESRYAIGAYWAAKGPIDPEAIKLIGTLARSAGAILENLAALESATGEHASLLRNAL